MRDQTHARRRYKDTYLPVIFFSAVSLRSEKPYIARHLERLSVRGRATANQRRGGPG
jgi:hypothetical protein